jgi:hypothetical protein
MRVNNPNRSAFTIESRDPAQAPLSFMEIVSDYLPVFDAGHQSISAMLSRAAVNHTQNTHSNSSISFFDI